MKNIDTLVFDIQDIGSRYYTFIYTLANCMQTCKKAGVPVVVCDRPNPINGVQVEGNLVREGWHSFVGQYSLPNRHGMTVGELAKWFNDELKIGCDLTVVPMKGWKRKMWYDETGLLWVSPSPNMPRLSTAIVYPGMCLIEGTQLPITWQRSSMQTNCPACCFVPSFSNRDSRNMPAKPAAECRCT
jgi:uncharacterized protein YbbC (DUF1343 family)